MQRAKPYHSVATKPIGELARERGLNPGNVYSRIKDCRWTIEEALGIVARPRVGGRAKCIVVDGQEFPSNARAAKHFGINEGTWRKRLELGWTLNQAAGIEPPPAKLKAK
jgi:hypothetical protein